MSYVGEETRDGLAVEHLRLFSVVRGQSAGVTALIQALSTMELYLDAASSLPVAINFSVHPDRDASTDVPVEVQFGTYESVGSVHAAVHVRKLLQGTLVLDINVTAVSVNSGIPDSEFTF